MIDLQLVFYNSQKKEYQVDKKILQAVFQCHKL
jgi:hypothetical protein